MNEKQLDEVKKIRYIHIKARNRLGKKLTQLKQKIIEINELESAKKYKKDLVLRLEKEDKIITLITSRIEQYLKDKDPNSLSAKFASELKDILKDL